MRRLSRVVATVTAVATIGLSAACGGDNPTPSAAPSDTSSSAPTTVDPPEPPAQVGTKNKAGAVAAIKFFLASMEFAGNRGDVSEFRTSFAPSCTKCEAIAAGIERTYASGGSIEGGGWRAQSFKVYSIQGDIAVVDATVNYTEQSFQSEKGANIDRVPAQRGVLKAFQVTWDQRWRVGALDPDA